MGLGEASPRQRRGKEYRYEARTRVFREDCGDCRQVSGHFPALCAYCVGGFSKTADAFKVTLVPMLA